MRNMFFMLFVLFLASCGGGNDNEKVGNEPLGVSVTDALKADCPNGGVVINQGIDTNRNGKIDADEVSSTDTVCNGTNGTNGTDNKLVKTVFCSGDLPGIATGLTVTYEVDIFRNGDMFAAASVYGAAYEISTSTMYASGQTGADTAPVLFTYDIYGTVNGGYWNVYFNRTTLVSHVEYSDPDLSAPQTWTKPGSECSIENF